MSLTIRRGFIDVPDGQVHYREAGAGGARPLVLLHPSPGSGKMLVPLVAAMAKTRRTLALDTRGNGDSTPLSIPDPEIADFARATLAALDALGIGEFDLYGSHTGASIATETAILAPQRVKHLILDSMGLWNAQLQADHLAHNSPTVEPDAMGQHLVWAWNYCRDQYLFWPWYERTAAARRAIDLPSPQTLNDLVLEVLKALPTYPMSYRAAARYAKRERLPLVRVPTLACSNPDDMLIQYLDELARLVPNAQRSVVGDAETPAGASAAAQAFEAFLAR